MFCLSQETVELPNYLSTSYITSSFWHQYIPHTYSTHKTQILRKQSGSLYVQHTLVPLSGDRIERLLQLHVPLTAEHILGHSFSPV